MLGSNGCMLYSGLDPQDLLSTACMQDKLSGICTTVRDYFENILC